MDEEEIDHLLRELGLDVPEVDDEQDRDGLPPRLDEDWI